MKRFWTNVAVIAGPEGHAIALDARPVRTPGRLALAVPHAALAEAIADEWRAVEKDIDPRRMPLTGLANVAIERIAADPLPFIANLAAYAESDLLCYRADAPDALVARQAAAWNPLLDWARQRYDIHIEVVSGIIHRAQPALTLARLADALAARSPFALAGLSPIVTITGSLIAALALIEGAADAETVWRAAQVDENWQVEKWGDDDLAIATRTAHRADFDAGVRFLGLLG
ncbi:ATP12 family chaperone protein [Sphingomonas sp. 28-62-11]|uniref:ATP12 family chaperone protein n=1 Tax=Sphingomonas sp. 28-62-11 TaxID=1970432 RepID=UPI000BDD6C44|nr:MAG: ATPase [Sphingomonas sp. 28-62-11]